MSQFGAMAAGLDMLDKAMQHKPKFLRSDVFIRQFPGVNNVRVIDRGNAQGRLEYTNPVTGKTYYTLAGPGIIELYKRPKGA